MRAKRYTPKGITRCKCARCGNPARYQWSACATGNKWMAICPACDVGLNRVALNYILGSQTAKPMVQAYRRKIMGK